MKIYGHPMSTCTRKVLTTLAEKGHEAELVLVDFAKGEHKQPANLAHQPFGQIPSIEDDDGFQLYESRAICRYVDGKLSGPSLTPPDIRERAKMEQWISVETSDFTPHAMKIISQVLLKKMMGKDPDMAIVDQAKKDIVRSVEVLDSALATQEYLVGKFSLADVFFMPYIEYLFASGVGGEVIDSKKHVGAWWKRISQRPSWKKATAN